MRDGEGNERVATWATATRRWRSWYRESEDTALVMTDEVTGDELEIPATNRFMPSEQERLYAKLKDLERGVSEEYGPALTSVMLTLSASPRSGAGEWHRCPGNHLSDLLGGWSAVRRALARVLDGRDWEYLRLLEPHGGGTARVSASGYAHVHVAVFVRGPVEAEEFAPVLDAHVRNVLAAAPEAHSVEGAVSVNREVSNVGAYLSKYLMKWSEDPLEAPEHVQRFHALLWATGRRRWSASDGAQRWMSSPEVEGDPARSWEPTHLMVGSDWFPLSSHDGGALLLPIDGRPGLDPPPDMGG